MLGRGLESFASHLALRKRTAGVSLHCLIYTVLYIVSMGRQESTRGPDASTKHCTVLGGRSDLERSQSVGFSLLVFVVQVVSVSALQSLDLVSLNSDLCLLHYIKSESRTVCKTYEEFSLQGYSSGFSSSYSPSLVYSS